MNINFENFKDFLAGLKQNDLDSCNQDYGLPNYKSIY